ncbi:hypothetical protein V2J09_024111 [Rumex salicifolius]
MDDCEFFQDARYSQESRQFFTTRFVKEIDTSDKHASIFQNIATHRTSIANPPKTLTSSKFNSNRSQIRNPLNSIVLNTTKSLKFKFNPNFLTRTTLNNIVHSPPQIPQIQP